jgi:hypothetical protein
MKFQAILYHIVSDVDRFETLNGPEEKFRVLIFFNSFINLFKNNWYKSLIPYFFPLLSSSFAIQNNKN